MEWLYQNKTKVLGNAPWLGLVRLECINTAYVVHQNETTKQKLALLSEPSRKIRTDVFSVCCF